MDLCAQPFKVVPPVKYACNVHIFLQQILVLGPLRQVLTLHQGIRIENLCRNCTFSDGLVRGQLGDNVVTCKPGLALDDFWTQELCQPLSAVDCDTFRLAILLDVLAQDTRLLEVIKNLFQIHSATSSINYIDIFFGSLCAKGITLLQIVSFQILRENFLLENLGDSQLTSTFHLKPFEL